MNRSDAPTLSVHDDSAFADAAAEVLAAELETAVRARGRAIFAISGGRTPLAPFARLATKPLPWEAIDVFQVDERCTPPGHEERNAVQLERAFGSLADRGPARFHWVPLDSSPEPRVAARIYSATLTERAGDPPLIDVVQLGLGDDGHTASLFPGNSPVPITPFVGFVPLAAGWPRITLTLAALNAVRRIVWLVEGAEKVAPLRSLIAGETAVVGSQIRRTDATIVAARSAFDPTSSAT
jgi:6-phosphogluconolactonase